MLYGRDRERADVGALLDGARASRSGALVVLGDPGVGKTALLEDARERAVDMHVLNARGVESESELPFAALHQLLLPALSLVERLPAPQANALRASLGLSEGPSAGQERFLVYSACLSLLSELAERRPVLCVIDDAHWLDATSVDALLFVARRLDAEGIVFLFAAREGEERSFDPAGMPTLHLTGLDDEAAATLLTRTAGQVSPWVHEYLLAQSRGNPLALVELPTMLSDAQLVGSEPMPESLPMTRQLETVFHGRAARLPPDTRSLLLVAAADDSEDAAIVHRAGATLGSDPDALDAAERAGLVVIRGGSFQFRHPLVRSAVYGAATARERREAHRALADALAGEEGQADRRAWHLASSAVGYDEEAVRALDEAAGRAEGRAGHITAARVLERAAELSADPAARGRRLTRAAWATSLAGRDERAVALANQAEPLVREAILRAELARVRGLAAIRSGRPLDVVEPLVAAARETATEAPATALELLMYASSAAWQGADRPAYLEIARFAREVIAPGGDERSAFIKHSLTGYAAMMEGDTATGVPLLTEALDWSARCEEPLLVYWSVWGALWLGDAQRLAELVNRSGELARARGELGTLTYALGARAAHLVLRQRFGDALVAASEALQFAGELGAANLELTPRGVIAIVAAVRGQDDEARLQGEQTLVAATANELPLRASLALHALALIDLGRSRWAEAHGRLDALIESEPGALDPLRVALLPDAIEAAVRAGRRDRAEATLALLEDWARHADAGAQPRLASCRALLAEGEEATRHHLAALEQGAEALPFDLARITLLYGEHLRRERRRIDSRDQLRKALDMFERMGADPWAERARAELRATGEVARKRDPSTSDTLTPQELQVARLVAEGLPNKEVAAQLFLSPRTIDAHLRSIFVKLAVTSRTQLARMPLDSDDPISAPDPSLAPA